MSETPLFTSDTVVLGLLALTLGAIFYTTTLEHRFWKKFYAVVPALLLCYFIPALYNTFGIIDGEHSQLYYVASRYLLPACLVLLTLSIDLKAILRLGPKAVIMFLTGTAGIVIGGPLALLVWSWISPETVGGAGPDAVWRGMTTIAGSWIGGGANQAAMKEVFEVGDNLFGMMIAVDVLVANLWMAVLLYLAARAERLDARMGADTTAIEDLKRRVEKFRAEHARITKLPDLMLMGAVAFGATGFAHLIADWLAPWIGANFPELKKLSLDSSFFWVVVIATTIGLLLSFTRTRNLEGASASAVGSSFLYILVATIGMHMDLGAIFSNPGLFGVGLTWMAVHAALLLLVAKLIRAPVFYMAVGSQANVGGAASAPVVASAFHPSLAPVGVLLAVFGYALGTYMAWVCGQLMRLIAT